jgi:hypothetical protein
MKSIQEIAVYVVGYVIYIDNLGISRRTAFCRQLDYSTGRFAAVSDADYEYAD